MTLDDALRLDVRALLRWLEAGPFDARWLDGVIVLVNREGRASIGWPNGASAAAWLEAGKVVVELGAMREQVRLVATPCGASSRSWAECPGCAARVAVLYAASSTAWAFRCRRCTGLAYGSQNERAAARGLRKARRVVAAQGGPPDAFAPLPRPLGQHWLTYARKMVARGEALDAWMEGERRSAGRFWGKHSPLASVREQVRWGLPPGPSKPNARDGG